MATKATDIDVNLFQIGHMEDSTTVSFAEDCLEQL